MQYINDLINTAFINPEGAVNKMFVMYQGMVNAYGFPICKEAIGCQYVKTLLKLQHDHPDETYDYYNTQSKAQLQNWIMANYK